MWTTNAAVERVGGSCELIASFSLVLPYKKRKKGVAIGERGVCFRQDRA